MDYVKECEKLSALIGSTTQVYPLGDLWRVIKVMNSSLFYYPFILNGAGH